MNKLILILLILTSCSRHIHVSSFEDVKLSDLVGKKIVTEGTALNAKLGALLITKDGTSIWIDELDSWPEGYYYGGDKGKTVKVTGTLIEKNDLPVFIQEEDDLPRSGMPVPEGTDLKKASRRYLIKDAKWEIVLE